MKTLSYWPIEINNTYKPITREGAVAKSEAAPYIIAYAYLKNGIIFTYESMKKYITPLIKYHTYVKQ